MKTCFFSICARNYLAQALTLRYSLKQYTSEEFRIYVIDFNKEIDCCEVDNVYHVTEDLLPNYHHLAMKYDVTEYSTSLKPFCFNQLFKEGYDKVIYLDPDMYVYNSLDYIIENLNRYSIILTPHFCNIQINSDIIGYDTNLLCDGIYNLGFVAIKNDEIGRNIVEWWMNRLYESCYNEKCEGLFTDQKWMIYVPMFYPNETLISHHFGINVAVWNLHERSLILENGSYIIVDKKTNNKYPLIIFHFSGFNPKNRVQLTRRRPEYNVRNYPDYIQLINEYADKIIENNYEKYSSLNYLYNYFENGDSIYPLHRRIYRGFVKDFGIEENPFRISNTFYSTLYKKGLIINNKINHNRGYNEDDKKRGRIIEVKFIQPLLRVVIKLLGIKRYSMLVRYADLLGKKEYHYFLIKK